MKNLKSMLKISMPLIVTMCTIFIGNYCVIQPFQEKTWKEQNKLEHQNEIRKEAIKYFEELSDLMDKRLFLTRQFFWSIKSNKNQKEKNLRNIVNKWNEQLNKNIVKVAIYFKNKDNYKFNPDKCEQDCNQNNNQLCECSDKERKNCLSRKTDNSKWTIENEWECNIHLNFRCIYNNTLKNYKKNPYDKELKTLAEDQLDCLNHRIYQFNQNILELITTDKTNKNKK